jgi:hypothetical protein
MFFKLKSISAESIPEALAKVERYRLLNEPSLAESICLDILAIAPDNQNALIALLLARTDQFHSALNTKGAHEVLGRIRGEYEKAYYAGIIWERLGHASLQKDGPGGATAAYHALREAMGYYEKAEAVSPAGNDDAILRWNTCAREITQRPEIVPEPEEEAQWERNEAGSRIADV